MAVMAMFLQTFTFLLAFLISLVSAVQNVKVQGSNFVNNVTNNRVQIIGVAYQPGGSEAFGMGSDPLSNGTLCLRDAALMQSLGINAVRTYNVDSTLNHDECASIFNAVGIYMIIDVNSPLPNQSLNPGDLEGSYSSDYLNRVFSVVEGFKDYPNLLTFVGGNEVMNTQGLGGTVPPYLRAVTRDLKNYIAKHANRMIPVGYSAADVSEILVDSWSYLSCDIDGKTDDPSRSDWFGINSYSWCGPTGPTANYVASSYNTIITTFGDTSIPIFFSEYGCNKMEPRVFDEVPVIYGNMTDVMSGGLVYEWYQEISNNYGLVWFYDNNTAQLRTDYDNLRSQYKKLDLNALQSSNASAANIKSPQCSSGLISSSSFNNSFALPNVPSGAQDMIDNGIKNPPTGKIVSVSATAVPSTLPVYASNGNQINNLAIKPLPDDQSNVPNGGNPGGSSTGSGSSPSPTKKGNAVHEMPDLVAIAAIAAWAVLYHA